MKSLGSQAVLTLNASLEPLAIISVRRATLLILADKATCLATGEGELRSETFIMPTPSVIKLNNYVRVPYITRVGLSKKAVLQRDRGLCAYCNKKADTIDHVIPRSKGGDHAWPNVVSACRRCNHKKGAKTLEELGWTLDFKPEAPRGLAWRITSSRSYKPEWAAWGV